MNSVFDGIFRFLRELRRRRVPHALGLYLVVAFGIVEAADLSLPRLGLPDSSVTLVLVLLLLALPLVAILAWFYDIGGGGIQRTEPSPTEPSQSNTGPAGAANGSPSAGGLRGAVITGVVMVALLVAAGWLFITRMGGDVEALRSDRVAVLPFRTTGEADDLGDGMVDLLAAKLTGEGGLRAVEPRAVLAAWRSAGGSGEDAARNTAENLEAGRLLLGSVVEAGGQLHLAGRIHDTATFEELARYEMEGPADSLPRLVDRFAAGLLTQVAGVDADRVRQLEGTPLPALRAYLDGQAALRAGQFHEAVELFDRAISRDSTFALAGMFHDIAASFTTRQSSVGRRLAWEHRDKLSPRDRAMLEGWWAGGEDRTIPERLEGLAQMTRAVPDRAEAWYLRGDYHFHFRVGEPLRERLEIAQDMFTAATALDPDFGPANLHLLEIALLRGDSAAAVDRAESILAASSEGDLADGARWILAALRGDTLELRQGGPEPSTWEVLTPMFAVQHGIGLEAADRRVDWALERLTDARTTSLASISFYMFDRGRPGQAQQIARERLRLPPIQRLLMRVYGALYWESGLSRDSLEQAVRELELLAAAGDGLEGDAARCAVAQAEAHLGRQEEALRTGERLSVDGSDSGEVCGLLVRALVYADADSEQGAAAIKALDRAHSEGRIRQPWLRDAAALVLARGYEAMGELERALEATLRRVVGVPGVRFYSTHLREEARIAARLGRTEQAARAYRHYLNLRDDAELPVQPMVQRARRELAQLSIDQ